MYIIPIMFGMIEWGNTGVQTGGQIRRAGTVVIMTLIGRHRITMVERCAVTDGVPIMKNAPRRIGRE